jgi:CRISPR/Cas system-associated exonuclease Cas4 (RecB family)
MSDVAPWSFSKIKAFEQCPKKFYHLRVARTYKEPETEAMRYGTEVHEAAEHYVRDGVELAKPYEYIKGALDALKAKKGEKLCEYKMGLTENLEPCGFFDDDVWWRGIADLIILDAEDNLAWVIDYKTGKSAKYADKGQLELMALAVFKHFPVVQTVRAGLLFVVSNELIRETYQLHRQSELWEKWITDFMAMRKAYEVNVWNPKPSGLCKRHCVVTECVHNGRH